MPTHCHPEQALGLIYQPSTKFTGVGLPKICDLSCENVQYGFSVFTQKTVHEPFIIHSQKNVHTCAWLRSSIRKKIPYVRTAKVICSERIPLCAHGKGDLFRKNLHLCEWLESTVQ